MTNPERDDIDLDDPQINALTTPELDGDDIEPVADGDVGDAEPTDADTDA